MSNGSTRQDRINAGLMHLAKRQRSRSFRRAYKAGITQEQAIGVLIAQYFNFEIGSILATFKYALEDGNAHSVVCKLEKDYGAHDGKYVFPCEKKIVARTRDEGRYVYVRKA